MDKSGRGDLTNDSNASIACKDLARGLTANHYDFYVYADNITSILIHTEKKYWSACLDTLPPDVVQPYLDFLHTEVEACDFQPFPGGSLFGGESDADIEKIKLELWPKYVVFVQFAKNKFI